MVTGQKIATPPHSSTTPSSPSTPVVSPSPFITGQMEVTTEILQKMTAATLNAIPNLGENVADTEQSNKSEAVKKQVC